MSNLISFFLFLIPSYFLCIWKLLSARVFFYMPEIHFPHGSFSAYGKIISYANKSAQYLPLHHLRPLCLFSESADSLHQYTQILPHGFVWCFYHLLIRWKKQVKGYRLDNKMPPTQMVEGKFCNIIYFDAFSLLIKKSNHKIQSTSCNSKTKGIRKLCLYMRHNITARGWTGHNGGIRNRWSMITKDSATSHCTYNHGNRSIQW